MHTNSYGFTKLIADGTESHLKPNTAKARVVTLRFVYVPLQMYHGTPNWRSATMLNALYHAEDNELRWDPGCPAPYRDLVIQCVAKEPNVSAMDW